MRKTHLLVALGVVGALGGACKKSQPIEKERAGAGKNETVFPVETRNVQSHRVEYSVKAVGSLEAFEVVQVTARVAGAVERVHFREGDVTKKGKLLVEIEPRRFSLAVASARASLNRAKASKADATRELERAVSLQKDGVGTTSQIASWQTKLATASADEALARASLDLAALNLRDARVQAPIAGTLQTRGVRTGQYVQTGTVLATLVQRDPLLLRFKVAEDEASRIRVGQPANFELKGQRGARHARIRHVAASADSSTRMVDVIAEVDGEADGLRAGAFAEVSVPTGVIDDAPVVPETSVRPSEKGFLAYVIVDGVAKERVLSLGLRTAEGDIEVKKGLSAGEQVVVRGAEALKDGARVKVGVPDPLRGAAPSAASAAGAVK